MTQARALWWQGQWRCVRFCCWLPPPLPNDGGTSTGDLGLTDDQVEFFNENGYLVVPDFWTRDTCANLITRANEIVHDFEPATVSIFSTNEQVRMHLLQC